MTTDIIHNHLIRSSKYKMLFKCIFFSMKRKKIHLNAFVYCHKFKLYFSIMKYLRAENESDHGEAFEHVISIITTFAALFLHLIRPDTQNA